MNGNLKMNKIKALLNTLYKFLAANYNLGKASKPVDLPRCDDAKFEEAWAKTVPKFSFGGTPHGVIRPLPPKENLVSENLTAEKLKKLLENKTGE